MKKFTSLLLLLIITFSLTACAGKTPTTPQNHTPDNLPVTPSGTITVSLKESKINLAINSLTTGYETITLTKKGTFELNTTAFENLTTYDNKDGTKTYTFTLKKDLKFSDKSKITAKNYLYTVLTSDDYSCLLGFDGYKNGEFNALKGARLINDYTFSLTLKTDAMPFYYESSLLKVTPTPYPEETDVLDSENGAIIKNYLLAEPIASSGAYYVESTDNNTIILKVNPYFLGNYELQKPTIERINLVNDSFVGEIDLTVDNLSPSADENIKSTLHAPIDYSNVFLSCNLKDKADILNALNSFAELENPDKTAEYLLTTAEFNLEEYNNKWKEINHTINSDKLYDHSSNRIRGYSNITPYWDWTKQILYCFIARE